MEYIILIILWCVWCLIHSTLASLAVNNYLKDKLGSSYRFYRLFYNIIALITLIPFILYGEKLTGEMLFHWDGVWNIIRLILGITGILLFISGVMKYDMRQFIGIRQINSGKAHTILSETDVLDTSGILSIIRHPWYMAAIIYIWICHRDMYISTLIVNVILNVYIVIGTIIEENKLIAVFGDNYRDYQKQVSMIFPVKWIYSKLSQSIK